MTAAAITLSPDQLLQHWQGHRGLTRRVIEAFPEEQFGTFSVGGMRPMAALAKEIIEMAVPTLQGTITRTWDFAAGSGPWSKAETLERWDATTAEIHRLWPTIPPHRFQEVDTAFGQWKSPGYVTLMYIIDNEIHHRGQGYVYLRALGIEPPPFYER